MNNRLVNDLELGRFVTVFMACMEDNGTLTWAAPAGHGPILCRRGPGHPIEVLDPTARDRRARHSPSMRPKSSASSAAACSSSCPRHLESQRPM